MSTQIEKHLWNRARKYVGVLRFVPFIKMVAICNNMAFGKVDEESDIDLFIVARRGRLFTVRIMVTVLLHVMGVRRHGDKVAGRFCLSFFMDEDAVDLSQIALERDFYLAYWVNNLIPMIDERNDAGYFSEKFLRANEWTIGFFEDSALQTHSREEFLEESWFCNLFRGINSVVFGCFWGDLFEGLMKSWQLKRARAKAEMASEKANLLINEHILKFHNIDRRRLYNLKWREKYGMDVKLSREKFLTL